MLKAHNKENNVDNYESPVTGIVFCAQCGNAMQIDKSRRFGDSCYTNRIDEARIIQAINAWLIEVVKSAQQARAAFQAVGIQIIVRNGIITRIE